MPATHISLNGAKQDKLFYFVANAMVFRERDRRCLILKRHEREKVHPGKFATPGGKLEWKDLDIDHPTRINGDVLDFEHAVEDLLKREVREEAGIEIQSDIHYISSVVFVRPDGIPVVLVKFAVKYKSGEVKIDERDFTDFAWVNEQEVASYDCVKGVAEEIQKTVAIFS